VGFFRIACARTDSRIRHRRQAGARSPNLSRRVAPGPLLEARSWPTPFSPVSTRPSPSPPPRQGTCKILDPVVNFSDADEDLAGGKPIVTGLPAFDRVTIFNQGPGAGQIGVSGHDVTFGGTVIGTFTGGVGTPLAVAFNAAATSAAVCSPATRNEPVESTHIATIGGQIRSTSRVAPLSY